MKDDFQHTIQDFHPRAGDGTGRYDDQAFQDGLDWVIGARGARLLLPPPVVEYDFHQGGVAQPASGQSQCRFSVVGYMGLNAMVWRGPPGGAILTVTGAKDSYVGGLNACLTGPGARAIRFKPTKAAPSMSFVTVDRCTVHADATATNCQAFLLGQGGGYSDMSRFTFSDCLVDGGDRSRGNVGYHVGANQAQMLELRGCGASLCGGGLLSGAVAALTTSPVSPADTEIPLDDTLLFPPSGLFDLQGETISYAGKTLTSLTGCVRSPTAAALASAGYVAFYRDPQDGIYTGSQALRWEGGGSSNATDFVFSSGGTYAVSHYGEAGSQFLRAGWGASLVGMEIDLHRCNLSSYTPRPDGTIRLRGDVNLRLRSSVINGNSTPFGDGLVVADPATPSYGSVHLDGLHVEADATPLWRVPPTWRVRLDDVRLLKNNRPQGTSLTGEYGRGV